MTDAILLVYFVHEKDRIHGLPAHEWLLAQAHACGAGGGSVFRAVAGSGAAAAAAGEGSGGRVSLHGGALPQRYDGRGLGQKG